MERKKKICRKFLTIVLVLLIGTAVGFLLGKIEYLPKNNSVVTSPQIAQENQKDSFVGNFKVMRVIDGDTIEIEGGEKVRYIGMDAPETVDPVKPVECFGPEASNENKKLVEGKIVRLEKDTSERDKYGRLLRYVYVGDDFIDLDLVQQGFARVETIAPDTKFEDQLVQAQQQAGQAKKGLWSACP
jgi:micrococcal nuclease